MTRVQIDVQQIPKSEMDRMSNVIIESAKKFYENPANAKAFEEWKANKHLK